MLTLWRERDRHRHFRKLMAYLIECKLKVRSILSCRWIGKAQVNVFWKTYPDEVTHLTPVCHGSSPCLIPFCECSVSIETANGSALAKNGSAQAYSVGRKFVVLYITSTIAWSEKFFPTLGLSTNVFTPTVSSSSRLPIPEFMRI